MMNKIGNTIIETVIDVFHELNDTIPQQKSKLDINKKKITDLY